MRPFEILTEYSVTSAEIDCFNTLDPQFPTEYRELAVLLVSRWQRTESRIVGLGGGQGSGKSTLCSLIGQASSAAGDPTAILCLDDFYLTKIEREALAATIHPSLQTRGPPGTHDVELLISTAQTLSRGHAATVPLFDKGLDDRVGFRSIEAGVARVVIEGWCIGAAPEPSARLRNPINRLERAEDPSGRCRSWINDRLAGPYNELTSMLNELAFVRIPSMESVRAWRLRQEQDRPIHLRMDKESVDRFVEHYERITLWMLEDLPSRADVVISLDELHNISALRGFDQNKEH